MSNHINRTVEELTGLLRDMARQIEHQHALDLAEVGDEEDNLISTSEFAGLFSRWMVERLWNAGFEAGYEAHREDAKNGKLQQYVHAPTPFSDRVKERKAQKAQGGLFQDDEQG